MKLLQESNYFCITICLTKKFNLSKLKIFRFIWWLPLAKKLVRMLLVIQTFWDTCSGIGFPLGRLSLGFMASSDFGKPSLFSVLWKFSRFLFFFPSSLLCFPSSLFSSSFPPSYSPFLNFLLYPFNCLE